MGHFSFFSFSQYRVEPAQLEFSKKKIELSSPGRVFEKKSSWSGSTRNLKQKASWACSTRFSTKKRTELKNRLDSIVKNVPTQIAVVHGADKHQIKEGGFVCYFFGGKVFETYLMESGRQTLPCHLPGPGCPKTAPHWQKLIAFSFLYYHSQLVRSAILRSVLCVFVFRGHSFIQGGSGS